MQEVEDSAAVIAFLKVTQTTLESIRDADCTRFGTDESNDQSKPHRRREEIRLHVCLSILTQERADAL